MNNLYHVRLTDIIREFNLDVVHATPGLEKILIVTDDINRPGLQLAGFFDYFDASRIQIVGKVEASFAARFTPERRRDAFEKLLSKHIPALIFSRAIKPFPECLELADKYDIPVLSLHCLRHHV